MTGPCGLADYDLNRGIEPSVNYNNTESLNHISHSYSSHHVFVHVLAGIHQIYYFLHTKNYVTKGGGYPEGKDLADFPTNPIVTYTTVRLNVYQFLFYD